MQMYVCTLLFVYNTAGYIPHFAGMGNWGLCVDEEYGEPGVYTKRDVNWPQVCTKQECTLDRNAC